MLELFIKRKGLELDIQTLKAKMDNSIGKILLMKINAMTVAWIVVRLQSYAQRTAPPL